MRIVSSTPGLCAPSFRDQQQDSKWGLWTSNVMSRNHILHPQNHLLGDVSGKHWRQPESLGGRGMVNTAHEQRPRLKSISNSRWHLHTSLDLAGVGNILSSHVTSFIHGEVEIT